MCDIACPASLEMTTARIEWARAYRAANPELIRAQRAAYSERRRIANAAKPGAVPLVFRVSAREAARDAGLLHYATGKPCKRGHNGLRWVKTGICCDCGRMAVAERKKNPLGKLASALRSRVYVALKRKRFYKNSPLREVLGIELDGARKHIEAKFSDGMTWANHGEWHIDHIKPLAHAKDISEPEALCHYTNLQPLWALENFRKGARPCPIKPTPQPPAWPP